MIRGRCSSQINGCHLLIINIFYSGSSAGRCSGAGQGSTPNTLAGGLQLAVILNIINFENGYSNGPHLTLGSYWQTIVRGAFLLAVIVLQARLAKNS
jgi:ribose/xylose/arabinose/galactoside ABC-type transport system permease subunit